MFLALFVVLFMARAASLDLVCGINHNCVFEKGQEAMKCWGENGGRQLGYDTSNRGDQANEMGATLIFVNIGTGFVVEDMQLGERHSCAKSVDRAMKCFGNNAYEQLGFAGLTTSADALPFLVFGADFNLSKIAAGNYQTCALSTDAALKCFGYNFYGQCGAGMDRSRISGPPSQINAIDLGANFTAVDVSAFWLHVCVKSQQGTAKCFGYNGDGQLGYGDTTDRGQTPESMGDGLPILNLGSDFIVAAIATGNWHSCALSTTKTVKCWGCGGTHDYGQCGTPHSLETGDDLPVLDLADFVPMQLAVGGYHTCILAENAALICFGDNTHGQLGLGNTADVGTPSTLTGIDLGTGFVPRQVAAGGYHNCAVSTTDAIKCWGYNNYGQLGLGHANSVGDGPYEMGNNLPFVDVDWPTTGPTTAAPTTGEPTTTGPTTPAPTTAAPTTAEPTTPATATATEYRVTIEFRSASCADILATVADALDASLAQVTVAEEACEDEDDGGEEGSDATTTATLLVAIADVQLDSDVIQSTLREAMVKEYGEDIVDVGVEEEEDEEEDTQSRAANATLNMVAGGLIGAFLCGICGGAFCWCYRRRMRRRPVQQQAQPQPQQPHMPQRGSPDADAQRQEVGIEMVPRAVAEIEPGAYHANADVDDEKENEDDADGSTGDENDDNAAVTPGIHQVATFVAGAENSDSEQLYNDNNNNDNDKGTRNPTPTNATTAGTSGGTVGRDSKLGVYELNNMVDL